MPPKDETRNTFYKITQYGNKICPVYVILRSQPAFTSSKLTIETLEKGVKYVQN